ncbi:MAG: hypothetical protein MJZ68_05125, partial [archaeon]|nr:hypothetical protein [archaeon]
KEFHDLYGMCRFLERMALTNEDESEATVSDEDEGQCAHCMTVHGAKGLEFDTVVLPYTDRRFVMGTPVDREQPYAKIVVGKDRRTVGWTYADKYTEMENENYHRLMVEEGSGIRGEEVRLLYVALTRTIHGAWCFVRPSPRDDTWGRLLRDGGIR